MLGQSEEGVVIDPAHRGHRGTLLACPVRGSPSTRQHLTFRWATGARSTLLFPLQTLKRASSLSGRSISPNANIRGRLCKRENKRISRSEEAAAPSPGDARGAQALVTPAV